MADEALENELTQPSEAEKRIKTLSSKVKEEAEAKEAALREKSEAEAKAAEAQKERDFFAGFSDVVATNPAAKDHRDEILAKVKSGYTTEDATYAVLGKAGKLGKSAPVEMGTMAGGSAATALPQQGAEKSLAEMTRDEKYAALREASDSGDLLNALLPKR